LSPSAGCDICECAEAPEARDTEGLDRLFGRLNVASGCGASDCYETKAATDIEHVVSDEMDPRHSVRSLVAR